MFVPHEKKCIILVELESAVGLYLKLEGNVGSKLSTVFVSYHCNICKRRTVQDICPG